MKQVMILTALLIASIAQAQFSLAPRIGLNENTRAVFAGDMAYRVGCIEPAIIGSVVLNQREAAYSGFRVGFIIPTKKALKVMFVGGRAYKFQSSDKNEYQEGKNYWCTYFGARVEKHLESMVKNSAVFIQADYLDQAQLTLGIKF